MWKWQKNKKNENVVSSRDRAYDQLHGRREFNNAMQFVQYGLEGKSVNEQIIILDYVARLVKKDLQYDLLTKIIYECFEMAFEINQFFPSVYIDNTGAKQKIEEKRTEKREIDLATDAAIILPWETDRMVRQIVNIAQNGFEYRSDNHWARYYTDLDICYIHNGNHSCSAGIGWQQGKIMANVVDLTPVFECIDTDGAKWMQIYDDALYEDVFDFRIAILYKVVKMKKGLEEASEI